jgi:hypothetical protein
MFPFSGKQAKRFSGNGKNRAANFIKGFRENVLFQAVQGKSLKTIKYLCYEYDKKTRKIRLNCIKHTVKEYFSQLTKSDEIKKVF